MPEFEFEKFWKIIFGRLHAYNIYIVKSSASKEKKKQLSDLQESHIWHRHLNIQVNHSYISKSVFCFTEG